MLDNKVQVFLKVAESGSFSKASKALYTSPVSVMKSVNLLESLLGFALFSRTPQGVELTEAGQFYYDRMHSIQMEINDTIDMMHRRMDSSVINVRYGLSAVSSIAQLDASLGFDLFTTTDFGVFDIDFIHYGDTDDATRQMLSDIGSRIDFILGPSMPERSEELRFKFFQLCSTPMQIAVPRSHPLAARQSIRPEDLAGEELMIAMSGLNPTMLDIVELLRKEAPGIQMIDYSYLSLSIYEEARKRNRLVCTMLYLEDVHHAFVTLPVEWDYKMPFGVLYAERPNENMKKFLAYLSKLKDAGYFREKYGMYQ